jgi:haloacid dehalogenase superfamily, subfamily IA, variant 1 with third motif having Dx(3-4)D or Dx(3-4)E
VWDFVLFDLDGTLTDPKAGITRSVRYALESFGVRVDDLDELCAFIGPPLRESFMKFYGFDEAQVSAAVAKYREYFSVTGIFENEVYAGVREMLSELCERGVKVVLATSKPAVFAERILVHFNLDEYFTFVSGSELDGRRVKKADVIRYAMDNCGITDVTKAVMVGDREHDIIGARAVGMTSVGVLYGYGSREELTAVGADHIVSDVRGLRDFLRADCSAGEFVI